MQRLSGLDLELTLRERPGWLSAFERPGRGELRARIELVAGQDREMRALSLRRDGLQIFANGDGLSGVIENTEAVLRVHGGDAGLRMALRLCCAVWGAPRGLFLFHGACALREGRARAYLGASGAGKTTLSRLLLAHDRQLTIVSDEVTVLDAGAARAHGHPFQSALGEGAAPDAGAPLQSISLLAHAPRTSVELVSPAEAARALLPRIFLPLRDGESIRAALDAVGKLVERVPVRRLHFAPDATAVAA